MLSPLVFASHVHLGEAIPILLEKNYHYNFYKIGMTSFLAMTCDSQINLENSSTA